MINIVYCLVVKSTLLNDHMHLYNIYFVFKIIFSNMHLFYCPVGMYKVYVVVESVNHKVQE